MKYLTLLILCLPCYCFGSVRLYVDKNEKPCEESKAHFYRDVDTLPNGKLYATTYTADSSHKLYSGVYTAIAPHDIADTVWRYDKEGKVKSKRIYDDYDYEKAKHKRSLEESYHPNGKVKSLSKYEDNNMQTTEWYHNGTLYFKYQRIGPRLDGEILSYYPNGQLKSKEIYAMGKLAGKGERYDSVGNPTGFYPFIEFACFGGSCKDANEGIYNFRSYVFQSLIYPRDALNEKAQGRAIVQFTIGNDGDVEDVKLLHSAGHTSLDYEAMRAIQNAPKWTPFRIDGKVRRLQHAIPIHFQLQCDPSGHCVPKGFSF